MRRTLVAGFALLLVVAGTSSRAAAAELASEHYRVEVRAIAAGGETDLGPTDGRDAPQVHVVVGQSTPAAAFGGPESGLTLEGGFVATSAPEPGMPTLFATVLLSLVGLRRAARRGRVPTR